jgi:hypothetical protein
MEARPLDPHANDRRDLGLIQNTLAMAVPMWVERLQAMPWEDVEAQAHKCVELITSGGDNILYRGNKRGQTAEAFNALAQGLAVLAFSVGGVRAFGLHFDAEHPSGRTTTVVPMAETEDRSSSGLIIPGGGQ